MNFVRRCAMLLTFAAAFNLFTQSQTTTSSPTTANPPRLIRFAGIVKDASAKAGTVSATFALYSTADGGSPLWLETQSVDVTAGGHFSTILGSVSKDGVPMDFFVAGEARWLGITIDGKEQPRVLLVSVPYAMKAGDADTLGGLTASEIASQAATIVQQDGATTQKTGTSLKTSAAMQSSISNSSVLNYTASSFTDTNGTEVVLVQQNGTGYALHATSSANNSTILGVTSATGGTGVRGSATAATGGPQGVLGDTASPDGVGVYGHATATTSTTAIGVRGVSDATTGTTYGVKGTVSSPTGTGVFGSNLATTGAGAGLQGSTASTGGRGLVGTATATTGSTIGLLGFAASSGGTAVFAQETSATGLTVGMRASVASASGIGAVIDNSAGGDIFWGRGSGSVIKFKVDGSGNVTGTSFAGSGTGLTSLDATKITNGFGIVSTGISGTTNTLGGYSGNSINGGVKGAVIVGGGGLGYGHNFVTDDFGFVGGGAGNQAGDNAGSTADMTYATVGGGFQNTAGGYASSVIGGVNNSATGFYSVVAGGYFNSANNNQSTIGGGNSNLASGVESVVAGGYNNSASNSNASVLGGTTNAASGQSSSVLGGTGNTASGSAASVLGGSGNTASGSGSVAAGSFASASYNNSFTWGDGSTPFSGLAAPNAFNVLATGGIVLATHQTSGTVDQYASISNAGVLTTTGGFSGNGSLLNNVNAIKLQSINVSGTAPVTGQALRYDGANWAPSGFVDVHYYPAGTCTDAANYPQWGNFHGYGATFTCINTSFLNTLVSVHDYSFNGVTGPVFAIPADWDGNAIYADTDWYLPSGSGTIQINYYSICTNPGSALTAADAGYPALPATAISDTNVHRTSNYIQLPSGCGASSVVHFYVARGDANTAPGPINVIGTNIRIGRKQ